MKGYISTIIVILIFSMTAYHHKVDREVVQHDNAMYRLCIIGLELSWKLHQIKNETLRKKMLSSHTCASDPFKNGCSCYNILDK